MTAILVTGGAGFIGSHTCKALRRAGFIPVTYDNLSRGNPEAVKWGPLEIGDLADRERLRTTIARHRPVAVVHFAALAPSIRRFAPHIWSLTTPLSVVVWAMATPPVSKPMIANELKA